MQRSTAAILTPLALAVAIVLGDASALWSQHAVLSPPNPRSGRVVGAQTEASPQRSVSFVAPGADPRRERFGQESAETLPPTPPWPAPQDAAPGMVGPRSPAASPSPSMTTYPWTEPTGASLPPCGCGAAPACTTCLQAVDCAWGHGAEGRWKDMRPFDFQPHGPGEYAGPPRLAHLADYRLRPGDRLLLLYMLTRRQHVGEYRLMVGDEVLIESIADEDLTRGTLTEGLRVQPDGTITVRLLGQVHAAGLTIDQLRRALETQYSAYLEEPAIDVTPVRTNTTAIDLLAAVGGASGLTQQSLDALVTPDGTVRLPAIGSVNVQGLTLEEMKREINLRYRELVVGLEVEPALVEQAPHFIYVLGEVNTPSRIQLESPTTVLGALAAAGGQQIGANMRQVVVFRRADDWRLVSTMLDLHGAALGKRPTPADEIWLRDGDVVIVPPQPIRRFDNFVQQVFTEGIYGVIPLGVGVNYGLGRGF